MMKIVAGLGSIDDYVSYVNAGADELFCGYVPQWWNEKYGIYAPLNRREVLYYNVQIGSKSELEILAEMVKKYQVPVSITLNALYYMPEQYPDLALYMKECVGLGFSSFIIADMGLLLFIKQSALANLVKITVSGEFAEMNTSVCDLLEELNVKRIIFHRKMTVPEMQSCMEGRNMEFEAFAFNEKCHFHGAFCNSLHCDELAHMCQVPYRLGGIDEQVVSRYDVDKDSQWTERDDYLPGSSGCGICTLWDMKQIGVTHLKVVGRGNYSEDMEKDIQAMVAARKILQDTRTKEEYLKKMKKFIFTEKCSGNCYYEEL